MPAPGLLILGIIAAQLLHVSPCTAPRGTFTPLTEPTVEDHTQWLQRKAFRGRGDFWAYYREALVRLIRKQFPDEMRPLVWVEIGTAYGGTSRYLLKHLPHLIAHAVDPCIAGYNERDATALQYSSYARQGNMTRAEFSVAWATALVKAGAQFTRQPPGGGTCPRYFLHHKYSTEAASDFEDASIDILFVDGLHTYKGVLADLQAYWSLLKPQSLLVLNDWKPHPSCRCASPVVCPCAFPGVSKAACEFLIPKGFQFIIEGDVGTTNAAVLIGMQFNGLKPNASACDHVAIPQPHNPTTGSDQRGNVLEARDHGVARPSVGKHRVLLVTLATPLYGRAHASGDPDAIAEPPANTACQLPSFCHHQKRILRSFDQTNIIADFRVLSATPWNVSRECPGTTLIVPDTEFLHAADQLFPDPTMPLRCKYCYYAIGKVGFLKWWLLRMVQYDFVLYMDLDIDIGEITTEQIKTAVTIFAGRTEALSADSDMASPVNTGIMLFRPSLMRYTEGLALVKTGNFDGRARNGTGWNGTGTPLSIMSTAQLKKFGRTYMVTHNSWAFYVADSDQGLFTWFGIQDGLYNERQVKVGHFWGVVHKPYRCARWVSNFSLPPHSSCKSKIDLWTREATMTFRRGGQRYRCQIVYQYLL